MVAWDSNYSVGIAELDKQHRHLFEVFYVLLEIGGTSADLRRLTETLNALAAYTRDHFDTEEWYMAQAGYPDLETHKMTHVSFRKKIETLRADILSSTDKNPAEALMCLYNWLVTHVCGCDRQYIPYVKPLVANQAGAPYCKADR